MNLVGTMAKAKPVITIVEQPAFSSARFRYGSEGSSSGYIMGINSLPDNKTYPTIRIDGYQGKAYVIVSCVTEDAPYRPHPHQVVGKVRCKNGVGIVEIPQDTMTVTFTHLGVQCVKKCNVEAALKVREEMNIDPFNTKFTHHNKASPINLKAVRLCFQVFTKEGGKVVQLDPVVSDLIHDKNTVKNLNIIKLSDCVSSVAGSNKDIVLVCQKIKKEDIKIRFFEVRDGVVVWEAFGDYHPSQSYQQTSLWFKVPAYKDQNVTEPVKVFIQLYRPSDGEASDALPFQLLPLDAEPGMLKRKRLKFMDESKSQMILQWQQQEQNRTGGAFQLSNLLPPPNTDDVRVGLPPISMKSRGTERSFQLPNLNLPPHTADFRETEESYRLPTVLSSPISPCAGAAVPYILSPPLTVDSRNVTPLSYVQSESPYSNTQNNLHYNSNPFNNFPLTVGEFHNNLPAVNQVGATNNLLDMGNHQLESMLTHDPVTNNWNIQVQAMQTDASSSNTTNAGVNSPNTMAHLLDLFSQQFEAAQSSSYPVVNNASSSNQNGYLPLNHQNQKGLNQLNLNHGDLDNADAFHVNDLMDSFSLSDIILSSTDLTDSQ